MPAKSKSAKGPQDQLIEAIRAKNADLVRKALSAGADANGPVPGSTFTPMMVAVGPMGHDDVAVALVEAGADPRATDAYGFTPLHYAAHLGKPRTCEALLRVGADPNALSTARSPSFEGMTKGATPLKVAGNAAIKKLLAGATTAGVPTDGFAKKLERVRAWASHAVDFEGGEPEVDALVGFEAEGFLTPIGQTGSGSIFALWSTKKLEEPKDGPVVYLDSEGDPWATVASSLDEFLSVLPFGTGWLYDAANGKPPPSKKALAAVAAKEAEAEDVDGKPRLAGKTFAAWWKATFGVAPAKDPEGIVAKNVAAKPSVESWLSKKAK